LWEPLNRKPEASAAPPARPTCVQELKSDGVLPASRVASALKALVSQPHSSAVKEVEVSEDLSFLAQQLRSLQAQGHRCVRACVCVCVWCVCAALVMHRCVLRRAHSACCSDTPSDLASAGAGAQVCVGGGMYAPPRRV
jgi:hypothetical protein